MATTNRPQTAAITPTLFRLPISPDDFGVLLPPADLRRIRFSALDFTAARRAIIEYIKSYYPNDFNDFVASNGVIMLMEIIAAETAKLALRGDLLISEAFMPTCQTEEALANHLALINQSIRRQTSATVDIQITVVNPVLTNIEIPAGTKLTATGPDNKQVIYEVYAAPGDFSSKIILPAGKRGVIAFGIEGQFASPQSFTSSGGSFQTFDIIDETMLTSPVLVTVTTADVSEDWRVVNQPIELYGPTDKVVEVNFLGNKATLRFGDDNTGKALLSGQVVSVRYRSGGGVRGRIGTGTLNQSWQLTPLPPANAPVQVSFTNPIPSTGGTDKETLTQAKKRAPRDFAVRSAIVTADDYAQAASSFSHPVFGTVAKAVATLRSSLNANLIEIYCLALGADGELVTPSAGLKRGLTTFMEDLNVLTDQVNVLDGAIKPVNVTMNVVVSKNADATVIKSRVEKTISDFFDTSNWQMGEPFYLSNLVELIEGIDGVAYVDLFEPADNILPTRALGVAGSPGVGFNELIVEGERTIRYYYEDGRI